jgi:anti-anti-sigma factor
LEAPATSDRQSSVRFRKPTRGLSVQVDATNPDLVAIRAAGNLDIYTIARLRERMERFDLATGGVVLDVSGVTLIDSSGLGTLLSFANRARQGGGRLALICTAALADVLEIARLADAFDLTLVDPAEAPALSD